MTQPNYYELLGVSIYASTDEIKLAYRQLIKKHHPDKDHKSSNTHAQDINVAYQTLKDPKKRATYDQKLHLAQFRQGRFFRTADFIVQNTDLFAKQLKKNWQQAHQKFKNSRQDTHNTPTTKNPQDIHQTLEVMPWQIALGECVIIQTPQKNLRLHLPCHLNHGSCLKVSGAGKTIQGKTGDLYLTLIVKNPATHQLTDTQRQAFLALKNAFEQKDD